MAKSLAMIFLMTSLLFEYFQESINRKIPLKEADTYMLSAFFFSNYY